MKMITISGLDGSGKSTQIELLKKYLESQGKKVFYFHAIQFGLANKLAKKCFFCHSERSRGILRSSRRFALQDDIDNKSVTKSGTLGIILRRIFLMIDIFRFKKLLKKLKKEGFDYLVSDRYFYDSVINIIYLKTELCHSRENGNLENKKNTGSRIPPKGGHSKCGMTKLIMQPDLAIYLQTDPEIIMQRERKPDQGIDYLKNKKELYDNAVSAWDIKIIDGNRNKEEIFEELKKALSVF